MLKIFSNHLLIEKKKSYFHFLISRKEAHSCVFLHLQTRSLSSRKPSIPPFEANLAATSFAHFDSSAASSLQISNEIELHES